VIDNCKELPILIQLLYDWIGDCVISVIPAQKIVSVFEKIPETDFKKESDKEFTKNICFQLKSILKSNEYECLVYIAKLACEIYPTKHEEIDLFNKVFEKLVLILTGINPRKISYKYGEKNDNLPSEISELFRKFNILVNFLTIVIKYDYECDTETFFRQILYNSALYGNKSNMTLLNGLNIFKSDKNPIQRTMISVLEEDKSFDFKNVRKLSSFQQEDSKERDKNMYQIYQMLNYYFCSNNSSMDEDPVIFDKDLNTSMIDVKEDQKLNKQIKPITKSKTIKTRSELTESRKKTVDSNEMIVELFENFQNFLKSQNLPKINLNKLNDDNSNDQNVLSQTEIKNHSNKNRMQIIEEDPNEGKFSRGISLINNAVHETKEEFKKGESNDPLPLKNEFDLKENKVNEVIFENPENNLIPVSSARIILPKLIESNTSNNNKKKSIFGYKFFQSNHSNDSQK
jgi:inhibitor of KinA sporulation pathway (predicted exonuclease)